MSRALSSAPEFFGIIAYPVTPFLPAAAGDDDATDGGVDTDRLAELVGRLVDGGVHAIAPLGSTGEAAYLLANGQGKARASRTGAARQSARWRLLFLSAGEESLSALMTQAGRCLLSISRCFWRPEKSGPSSST